MRIDLSGVVCVVELEEVEEVLERHGGKVERLVDEEEKPIRFLTCDQMAELGWLEE